MEKGRNTEKVTVKTVFKSILSGDILFLLGLINIFLNYKIEQTMVKVERNKVILEEYKIYHAQKTYEFVKLGRMSTVQKMLEEGGSEVTAPVKPAEIIKAD